MGSAERSALSADTTLRTELGQSLLYQRYGSGGICGSDVHHYTHGRIGRVRRPSPLTLGHEASTVVIETIARVTSLSVGDRVCMEPEIPNMSSRSTSEGMENVDPSVWF